MTTYDFLIVDDEPFIRTLAEKILQKLGAASTTSVASGAEALLHVDSGQKIDIVLCDLNMPHMDGVEFLRHLGERDFRGGVIFISGEDTQLLELAVDLGSAQNLTILGALPKPLRPAALQQLLKHYVPDTARHTNLQTPTSSVTSQDLFAALNERRLTVYYQPKVAMINCALYGAEALIRWHDVALGTISPETFIPIAEENGLIDTLTHQVLDMTIRQVSLWHQTGLDITVSINISAYNLNSFDLVDYICGLVEKHKVSEKKIILEITESQLMKNITKPLEILMRLRLKGFSVSIDDFGTGHSSMEQLKRLPFTELKIDRSFVKGADKNKTSRSILESSVALARKLNMKIVAEGVETRAEWDLMANYGVDYVQGYLIAKPLSSEDFDLWARKWIVEHHA